MRQIWIVTVLGLALVAPRTYAEGEYLAIGQLPKAVRPFVEKDTLPLFLAQADLNGDGRLDYILVLEKQRARESDPEIEAGQRPLLIIVQRPNGELKAVKRNDQIVYCSTCGGMMGDSFVGVEVDPKTFTVSHYGGSAWRWSRDVTFNYSRKDNTWQLVKVEEGSFHASAPDDGKSKTYTPPRHFGKIDIADFDPENWKGHGPK